MNHRRKLTLHTCFLAFFSRVIRYCSLWKAIRYAKSK